MRLQMALRGKCFNWNGKACPRFLVYAKDSFLVDRSWNHEEQRRRAVPQGPLMSSAGDVCVDNISQDTIDSNSNREDSQEIHIFLSILRACAKEKDLNKGTRVHSEILRRGLHKQSYHVANSLVAMYAKCGAFAKAQQLLEELAVRDVVSWTALIAGYVQHGHGEEALTCFEQMQCEGISPNIVTFINALKACGNIKAVDKGKIIHAEIVRRGLLKTNIVLCTALVAMYAKCGTLTKAQQVFDELPVQNVVSWSVLISGYAEHWHAEEALNCFQKMKSEGFSPNAITYLCALKACGSIGAVEKGEGLHDEIIRQGLLKNNIMLGNALLDMYAKCGAFGKAQLLLDELPIRDVVSWSAVIAGYAHFGHGEEALNCFEQMQQEGLYPNAVTFLCIVKACGSIGAADKGKLVHAAIVRQGLLKDNIGLGTALVDMYAKCGALAKAQQVLKELSLRNAVTWSALMAGYAQHGHVEEALNCFEWMQHEGLSPDAVTFSCVLNACSHSGLLHEGQRYFQSMRTKYGIVPDLEHYTCMVDLFGRAGHFDEAIAVIKKTPSSFSLSVWVALLGACMRWGNVKLGSLAFARAVELDEKHAAAYVSMSNMYVATGMQEDMDKVEAVRMENRAWS